MDDFNTLLYTPACSCGDMWDLYFPLQVRSDQRRDVEAEPSAGQYKRGVHQINIYLLIPFDISNRL